MSFENKGALTTTVTISMSPDRRGNFVCDGTADDVQFVAARDYCTALGGGLVHVHALPAGVTHYDISVRLEWDSYVNLEGEGRENTILRLGNDQQTTMFSIDDEEWISIRHLKLDGNKANNAVAAGNTAGLEIEDSSHVIVEDVWAYGCARHGFLTRRTNGLNEDIWFVRCRAEECTDNGWNMAGVSVGGMINCECTKASNVGIAIHTGCRNVYAIDCISWDNTNSDNIGAGGGNWGFSFEGDTKFCGLVGCKSHSNVASVLGSGADAGNMYAVVLGCMFQEPDGLVWGLDKSIISNNLLYMSSGTAIELTVDVTYVQVSNNRIVDSDSLNRGIRAKGDYCSIIDNEFHDMTTGIRLDVGADYNKIQGNRFFGCIPLDDQGSIGTIFSSKTFQFIQGTTFISADGSAKGWEINAEADMAVALGQLPLEVQQVVRLKIWAVALGAPVGGGGQMHLDIVVQAGVDDAAYTTENISLANFDSVTTDYVNNDVVHWSMDSSDDADIGDLVGGMSVECKINGGTAADPDGATNATFRVVEIEYV